MKALNKVRDGLVNLMSGLGTEKSKREHNQFALNLTMNQVELSAAYHDNWIAAAVVDYPAEDMTREWRSFKCDGAEEIRQEEDRVNLQEATQEALTWSRLYGGAAILMLTDQSLEEPLDIKRIKKGSLKRLAVFDRWTISPTDINTHNPIAENFLLPEYYTLEGGSVRVHWTHFARFPGRRVPLQVRRSLQGWGDSELRKCLEDIKDTVASKGGIAELMQEANIDVIAREGLNESLTDDIEEQALIKRYATFNQMKSLVNMAVLDKEGEELHRLTLNLSGVGQVLETFMTWVSGAADIPLTRLFGTSAKGMNATGEGDLNNYYNSLRSKQARQIDPPLSYLDQVLVRSALGHWPDDYNYDWNPLEQQNAVETAQAGLMRAQESQIYYDLGAVNRSQIMRSLQAQERFQFDEEKLTALEVQEDDGMFDEPVTEPGEDDEQQGD